MDWITKIIDDLFWVWIAFVCTAGALAFGLFYIIDLFCNCLS